MAVMPARDVSLRAAMFVVSCLLSAACIPYTVGTTAQTVPEHDRESSAMVAALASGGESFGDSARSRSVPYLALDGETRFGLSDRSDLGVRIVSSSGIVVNYKRRHAGFAHPDSAAFATMWGGGLINGGAHAHVEGTLLLSSRRRGSVATFGGVRLMQAIPIAHGAVHDDPTAGVFFGLHIGWQEVAVVPELGVYYDRSVLGLRPRPLMIIPSITLRGIPLPRIFAPRWP